jgi:hypothetical protein
MHRLLQSSNVRLGKMVTKRISSHAYPRSTSAARVQSRENDTGAMDDTEFEGRESQV